MEAVKFSSEFEVLVLSCTTAFLPERKEKLEKLIARSIFDWNEVLRLASIHSVRPLLLRGLSFIDKNSLPEKARENLKKECHSIAIRSLLNKQELLRILKLFREHNIIAIPFKGIIMAQEVYKNPILRENSDIDLFVYIEDLSKIEDILYNIEYKPEFNLKKNQLKSYIIFNCEYNFERTGSNNIKYRLEPHYKSNRYFDSLKLDLNELNKYLNITNFERIRIPIFSPNSTFLLITTHHGVQEGWSRLKCIVDIHALCLRYKEEIDWSWLLKETKKLDIENTFLIGIGLSQHLLNTPLPNSIKSLIDTPRINSHVTNRLEKLNNKHTVTNFEREKLSHWYYFMKTRKSLFIKAKMLVSHIFMPSVADIEVFNFPHRLFFLYAFVRPPRLLKKYFLKFLAKS